MKYHTENWITYKGKKYLSIQFGPQTFVVLTERDVRIAKERGKRLYKEIYGE